MIVIVKQQNNDSKTINKNCSIKILKYEHGTLSEGISNGEIF